MVEFLYVELLNCYHLEIYCYIYWMFCISHVGTEKKKTLCNSTDCSLPGSSVHGVFQARVPEWVAISCSRGSSQHRDRTQVSHIVGRCFYRLSHQGSQAIISWNLTLEYLLLHFLSSRVLGLSGFYKCWCSKELVAQWCPTLCDYMDCSPPGFSVHGLPQARIL